MGSTSCLHGLVDAQQFGWARLPGCAPAHCCAVNIHHTEGTLSMILGFGMLLLGALVLLLFKRAVVIILGKLVPVVQCLDSRMDVDDSTFPTRQFHFLPMSTDASSVPEVGARGGENIPSRRFTQKVSNTRVHTRVAQREILHVDGVFSCCERYLLFNLEMWLCDVT